jgi:YesN/AraC family two-component response regulator
MYRLLIADDEVIILRGLKKLLDWKALNIEIAGEALNGRDAEDFILREKPDLAILDIRMPLRLGLDILRTIREKNLETRVLFLSGHREFRYAQEALEYGAQGYLTKPVSREKLLLALRGQLARLEPAGTAPDPPDLRCGNEEINRIISYINSHYRENISLERAARLAYMNPSYFSVYFKKNTGVNFKEYLTRVRLKRAAEILAQRDLKTYELAELAGFTDPRYFSELFKKRYGKTPSRYRRGPGEP